MYIALLSFTTNTYDVRRKQILADDFTTQAEIQEFLRIGYIQEYNGTLEITENGEYDVKDYETADVDVAGGQAILQRKNVTINDNGTTNVVPDEGYDGLSEVEITTNINTFPPNWDEIGFYQTPTQILNGFDVAQQILTYWNPYNLNLQGKYMAYTELVYLPALEIINETGIKADLTEFCLGCSNLVAIGDIHISNLSEPEGEVVLDRAFTGCEKLIDVGWLDIHNIVSANDMFAQCNSLSDNSLDFIMAMLANVSDFYTGQKTLLEIGFNEDQAMRCEGLGSFQTLVELGWITGY